MNRTGSALVETVAAAALAAVLLAVSLALGRLALNRGSAQALARYAAEMASTGVPAAIVATETTDFAERLGLGPATVSTRRFLDLPSAAFYRLISADTDVSAARPRVLGGGAWQWTDRVVIEEE
jgi:hypothetical protein